MGKVKRERAGLSAVVAIVGGLVVLAGGAYAAAYALADGALPRDTRISGVAVGGLDRDEAAARLDAELADRIDRPIAVRTDGRTADLDPATAGLGVDADASVDAVAVERSWRPDDLWHHYVSRVRTDAVVSVNETALTSALAALTPSEDQQPVDGSVLFTRTGVRTTEPRAGRAVDPDRARELLTAALLAPDPATVDLDITTVEPDIDASDVQQAVNDFANPAMSAPVTLLFGDSPVVLRPRQYARALTMTPQDGALAPQVDADVLDRLVGQVTGQAGEPVDATVALVDGKPTVVPAKPGVTYDPDDVASTFLDLLTQRGDARSARITAKAAEPDFTTADARDLRIKERVSTFTTYFPYAEYRNTNIGRAAELVDGTVLKPGETFSLNGTVGERTRENGFTDGFIISDGIFKEDLGGGVSQMATTLFNAMFFAGLKDVEHKPHSFYIDRYPVGREATVAWGAVDLRFRNDTPYGVLISARVTPSTPSTQGVVTVSMYSTKVWDITTRTSDRYAFTQPKTRTLTTADCYPNTGYAGFSVDVYRYFRKPGADTLARTEKFHTVYTPSDIVICKKP